MASKIILKLQKDVVAEYILNQEETVIGRKPENSVHIDSRSISGRHARVIKIGSKDILEDLGSTNGTFINGKKVAKYVLKHGDNVMMGNYTLIYVDLDAEPIADTANEAEESDMDKTMILTPAARDALLKGNKPDAGNNGGGGGGLPMAGVQVLTGDMMGKTIDLSASLTSIGKADNCKIRVKGFTVSKQAAAITRRPSGYHLSYIGGLYKPKVNGTAVGDHPVTLQEGDIIELGDTKMEFFFQPA
ncbi:MAG: FHA domain-containing protein [Mariprofundales bacterium]